MLREDVLLLIEDVKATPLALFLLRKETVEHFAIPASMRHVA